jgi:hypothetical protein
MYTLENLYTLPDKKKLLRALVSSTPQLTCTCKILRFCVLYFKEEVNPNAHYVQTKQPTPRNCAPYIIRSCTALVDADSDSDIPSR